MLPLTIPMSEASRPGPAGSMGTWSHGSCLARARLHRADRRSANPRQNVGPGQDHRRRMARPLPPRLRRGDDGPGVPRGVRARAARACFNDVMHALDQLRHKADWSKAELRTVAAMATGAGWRDPHRATPANAPDPAPGRHGCLSRRIADRSLAWDIVYDRQADGHAPASEFLTGWRPRLPVSASSGDDLRAAGVRWQTARRTSTNLGDVDRLRAERSAALAGEPEQVPIAPDEALDYLNDLGRLWRETSDEGRRALAASVLGRLGTVEDASRSLHDRRHAAEGRMVTVEVTEYAERRGLVLGAPGASGGHDGGRHWTRTSDLLHVKHFRQSAVLGAWGARAKVRQLCGHGITTVGRDLVDDTGVERRCPAPCGAMVTPERVGVS